MSYPGDSRIIRESWHVCNSGFEIVTLMKGLDEMLTNDIEMG